MKFFESGAVLAQGMGVPLSQIEETVEAHYLAFLNTARDPDDASFFAYLIGWSCLEVSGRTFSGMKFYHDVSAGADFTAQTYHVAVITPVSHHCLGGLETDENSGVATTRVVCSWNVCPSTAGRRLKVSFALWICPKMATAVVEPYNTVLWWWSRPMCRVGTQEAPPTMYRSGLNLHCCARHQCQVEDPTGPHQFFSVKAGSSFEQPAPPTAFSLALLNLCMRDAVASDHRSRVGPGAHLTGLV